MITFTSRFAAIVMLAIAMLIMWVLLEISAGMPRAHARSVSLHLYEHIPTVSGIEASPSPAPFYRRGPAVRTAPSPAIMQYDSPAPPNGCVRPAFRVISGPRAARGCFGAQ